MTKIEQHRPVPAGTQVKHNSGAMTSTPAGGQVPPEQYRQPSAPVRTVAENEMNPAPQANRPLIHRQHY
jgi:hypothetical protein